MKLRKPDWGRGTIETIFVCFSLSLPHRRRPAVGAARGEDDRGADERRSHSKPRVPASEWHESLLWCIDKASTW